jgi:hypothetical protein
MQKTPLKFRIEQIAIAPVKTARAIKLLSDLGLTDWFKDNVAATGKVFGNEGSNSALLQFNYQAGGNDPVGKPLELEVLKYVDGHNWLDRRPANTTSHLGMHCSAEELADFRAYFLKEGISVAQEVVTDAHTNPNIRGERRYNYVIFDTVDIIGVDLKFIVRLNMDGTPYTGDVAIAGTKVVTKPVSLPKPMQRRGREQRVKVAVKPKRK